jgi:hypothetical protein
MFHRIFDRIFGKINHEIFVEYSHAPTLECSCSPTRKDVHSQAANVESRQIELQLKVSDVVVGRIHEKLCIAAYRIFDEASIFAIVQLFVDQTYRSHQGQL